MLEEKKAKEAALQAAQEESSSGFKQGDRVFHEIDFGKQGKKAVDALYANLKKF